MIKIAKDGTYRGGRRVRAGGKAQPAIEKIQKGKEVEILMNDIPTFTTKEIDAVDLAYKEKENPKIAVGVLIGHENCNVIIEADCRLNIKDIKASIKRIAGDVKSNINIVKQDKHLSDNQKGKIGCGDNGIFKGIPTSKEENKLSIIAKEIYRNYPYDGKYIIDKDNLIICQSNVPSKILETIYPKAKINPLGDWIGGFNVDTGATNRIKIPTIPYNSSLFNILLKLVRIIKRFVTLIIKYNKKYKNFFNNTFTLIPSNSFYISDSIIL